MPRTKCPICTQSTSTEDGACEFCGHELEAELVADAAERAVRLAAPARGGVRSAALEMPTAARPPRAIAPGGVTPSPLEAELHDAEQMGSTSFALAIVSIFFFPILAPVAFWLGRKSLLAYKKHGVAPHWTASTGYVLGAIWSVFVILALIALVTLLVLSFTT